MPVYYAKPANTANAPVVLVAMEIFGLHEYIKDVTRRLAKAGAFAVAPDYYFRKGEDLTKIAEIPKLMPIVNSQAGRGAHIRSRRHRGLGQVARRQHQSARHHGLLPRRTHGVDIRGQQSEPESRRGVLRLAGRSAERRKRDLAEKPDPDRARASRRRCSASTARPTTASRSPGGRHEGRAAGRRQDLRDQGLSGCAARLPRRLRQSYRKEAADDAWKEMIAWFKKYSVLA